MLSDLKIINPLDIQNWDELIQQYSDYSIFHSSYWHKVLQETYGYKSYYFVIENDGILLAAVPLMIVDSYLTGKRAVSLPYSDYCEPLVSNDISFNLLFDEIIKISEKEKIKYVEIRGGGKNFHQINPSSFHYTHILNLDKKEDELYSFLRKGTRSSIKKAERERVKVKIDNSLSSVDEYCRLNYVTRRKHGLPPQPTSFFRNLYKYIIAEDLGFISIAQIDGKNVAGAIYLGFGEKVLSKYSASLPAYLYSRANYLVRWESIKYCLDKGYKEMSFGSIESSNEGLRRYKTGWGAEESQINIYRYNLNERGYVTIDSRVKGSHNKIFNKTPIPLLKIFSSIFYKHFG